MSLYTIDRPMQVNDYHEGLVRAHSKKAKLMALIREGKRVIQWGSSWGVEPFKKRRDPTAAEGTDKTTGWGKRTPTQVMGMAQCFESEGWLVTEEAEAMPAGYDGRINVECGRQQSEDGKNFLLSIESLIGSDQDAVDASTGVNRRTRGAFKWLDPTQGAFQPVPALVRPSALQFYTGAFDDYGEDDFMAQIRASAEQQGQDVTLMGLCGLSLKGKLSMFNFKVQKTENISDTRTVAAKSGNEFSMTVDTFEYEGGVVRTVWIPGMMADRTTPTEVVDSATTPLCGLFLDLDMWRMQYLIRTKHVVVANHGGGKRGFHKGSGRLQCLNPMGQFAVKPA